jgi:tRNA G18 (ribose-2'-O)-methylase SpoU
VGKEISALATHRVAVPLGAEAESLNVAIAAGILLYEVLRDD